LLKTFIDLDIVANMIMVSFVSDRMLTNLVAICPGLVLFYYYLLVCTESSKQDIVCFYLSVTNQNLYFHQFL